ncbi:sensor histidine kinase [Actinomadura violacea]|uniref:histidine kinase n=1 Tax=Actinomadura violacea TaxID=2819934 RepID=A0ABS3RRD4_9ACTN|nr:sensor histidine kinase [Actinomadura violacea]MBO2459292.1 sensor histidine kinase [Actinomadura violacea]
MTGQNDDDASSTPNGLLRSVLAAAVTGRADPVPADRPWPVLLRWTRYVGIGRLPYGFVVNVVGVALAIALAAGTNSLLATPQLVHFPPPAPPGPPVPMDRPDELVRLIVSIAVTLPLALRDRHPLGAWRISFVAMAVIPAGHWLTVPYIPAGTIVAIVCLYTVAVRCARDITIGVGLLSLAGVWIKDVRTAGGASVLLLLALVVGYAVRLRNTSRMQLAEQRRELAEQEKRHQAAEAVLTERQRIARELHDVVAHHMSMIAIQAEAAPYKVEAVPDETRKDLSEIRATALDALTEMRRILGVLRSEDGAETAPQPSLERLDELVAHARGAGLAVSTRLGGDLDGLPPGVGLTAYRILQEALSNAMRHAPGSRVAVAAVREDGILRLGVVNGPPGDGHVPTPSPGGTGHGLVGMRERVSMLGGEVTARATEDGGFAVNATLPVKARAAT